MPCTFIFVRHGESRKGTNERGNTADLGLTETGVAQATAAGEWIVDLGLQPELIVHTRTARTCETAELIAKRFEVSPPMLQVAAGFRDLDGLHRKLNQWTRKNPAKVVLFSGHHSSQQALTRAFGLGIQSRERGVVVVGLPTGEPSVMAITPS
jgi:phosphohistidine phosphatase SixA